MSMGKHPPKLIASQYRRGGTSILTLCSLCALLYLLFIVTHSGVVSAWVAAPVSSVALPISNQSSGQSSPDLRGQSQGEADRKSSGCIGCHTSTDEPTMHPTKTVPLGCTDCHGGNSSISITPGTTPNSPQYDDAKHKAHVQPRDASLRDRSALPERMFTGWLKESAEYVKFVNPGDLRVAPETCGQVGCHPSETRAASTSMMTHSGMLWGAALYNNGSYPKKDTRFGESYNRDGQPQSTQTSPTPTP